MAWTTPRTWTTGEQVTKTILDTHIRDNLNYLKDVSTDSDSLGSDTAVNSGSWTDIDAGFSIDITPRSTTCLLWLNIMFTTTAPATNNYFTIEQDDSSTQTNLGDATVGLGYSGVISADYADAHRTITVMVTGLTPGTTYTYTPQMKTGGSSTVHAQSQIFGMDLP